jgi:hypothetical protein
MIQGFSSGLIGNRELIYETDLPSFQRDFAALKTLDHGTGPAITFTRASGATYFDANGVLQTAANDAPRFDHDPVTGASRGLLIEEARTNSLRNSQGGGAVVGVIGSGGVMPTNWGITANANGITSEILGTGTEDGVSYIEIKLSGTPTATSEVIATFEPATAVVAANSQTWTQSAYFKLSGGTAANAQVYVELRARTAGGLFISGQNVETNFTPTSASLRSQRHNVTLVTSDATVGRMLPLARVSYTSGAAIDLTLRIAAPQLELGAFATSYIPTTTAAATRSTEVATVASPNFASAYNNAGGTLFGEYIFGNSVPSIRMLQIDNATNSERLCLALTSGSEPQNFGQTGGVTVLSSNPATGAITVGAIYKTAAAFAADNMIAASNGTLGTLDSSGAMPVGPLGQMSVSGNTARGHWIRKIAYWPKRLTNTLLEQITT